MSLVRKSFHSLSRILFALRQTNFSKLNTKQDTALGADGISYEQLAPDSVVYDSSLDAVGSTENDTRREIERVRAAERAAAAKEKEKARKLEEARKRAATKTTPDFV